MPLLRTSSLRRHACRVRAGHGGRWLGAAGGMAACSPFMSRWLATLTVTAAVVIGVQPATAEDSAPVADAGLPKPAAAPPATPQPEVTLPPEASAFQPEDISIGEPISLPFATPLASPAPGRPQAPVATPPAAGAFQLPPSQLPSVVVPAEGAAAALPRPLPDQSPSFEAAAAGTGWLGIAVDDTLVTGRLVVVEVAPDGPAAKAGVRPQDMLLAINGQQLRNGDEMAAVLAAIVPGQRVKMAVGRDSRIEDVVADASARPPRAVSRDWQSSAAPSVSPNSSPAVSAAPLPAPPALAPSRLAPESTAVGLLPAPAAAPAPALATAPTGRTALGVRTVPVDPNVQSRFHLSDAQGAFVIGVVQDLPAAKAGVPPGSVIVAINHQPVRSPQDLTLLVARGPVGTPVPIQFVLPGGQSKQAEVVLQSLEQPLERALVGDGDAGRTTEAPSLQPAPLTTRRVQPTAGSQAAEPVSLVRIEELLRRMNTRLEQMERRLERIESVR